MAESLKLPAGIWKSALDGLLAVDDAGELARITGPTLLIWGERDEFFSRDGSGGPGSRDPRRPTAHLPGDGSCGAVGTPRAGRQRLTRLYWTVELRSRAC